MADEKLNTDSKDNKLPEAAVFPGTSVPPAPEPVKSPGDPPGHEQAVIPGMVEDTPAPAGTKSGPKRLQRSAPRPQRKRRPRRRNWR